MLENLQREDLNAIEIALSYKRLMDECDMTQEAGGRAHEERPQHCYQLFASFKAAARYTKSCSRRQAEHGPCKGYHRLGAGRPAAICFPRSAGEGLSVRQVEQLVKNMASGEQKPASQSTKAVNGKLPPAYKRIEDNMASHFSTRVKLDRKKNGKGAITIEFYNDDDLERIMEKMNL